jgi:hypothetical protein
MFVAGGHSSRDERWIFVVQARADIQRVVIVEHSNFRTLRCGLSFIGIALPEVVGRRRLRPYFVGQAPVNGWWLGNTNGTKSGARAFGCCRGRWHSGWLLRLRRRR